MVSPTCYRRVAKEMKDAEAIYEDKEVVIDRNLVASRQPGDLPAFTKEMIKLLKARTR